MLTTSRESGQFRPQPSALCAATNFRAGPTAPMSVGAKWPRSPKVELGRRAAGAQGEWAAEWRRRRRRSKRRRRRRRSERKEKRRWRVAQIEEKKRHFCGRPHNGARLAIERAPGASLAPARPIAYCNQLGPGSGAPCERATRARASAQTMLSSGPAAKRARGGRAVRLAGRLGAQRPRAPGAAFKLVRRVRNVIFSRAGGSHSSTSSFVLRLRSARSMSACLPAWLRACGARTLKARVNRPPAAEAEAEAEAESGAATTTTTGLCSSLSKSSSNCGPPEPGGPKWAREWPRARVGQAKREQRVEHGFRAQRANLLQGLAHARGPSAE